MMMSKGNHEMFYDVMGTKTNAHDARLASIVLNNGTLRLISM